MLMRSPFLAALLIASLVANVSLFLFPYDWQNDKYPPGESGSHQTEEKQSQAKPTPPSTKIQIECEPNCAAKHPDDSRYNPGALKRYFLKTIDDPVAGFTGLLFVATIILALIARNQMRDSRAIQRAYVAVTPHGVHQYHQAGNVGDDNIACVVGFKNVGNLPARNVAYAIRHTFSTDPTLAVFTSLIGCCEGNVVLPPGIEIKKGAAPPVIKSDFEKNRDAGGQQSGWLYIFGRVEYVDGFYHPRWIEFCFRYSLAGAKGGLSISEGDARYHEHGNHTDEDG
jgi:hypothetical protein